MLSSMQVKEATEFHKSKSYKDGLFGQCKTCCAAAAAQVGVRPAAHDIAGWCLVLQWASMMQLCALGTLLSCMRVNML